MLSLRQSIIIVGVLELIVALGFAFAQVRPYIIPPTEEQVARDLLSEISALIVLPENETPIIATVKDPAQLQDQAFLHNAQKGDKVLIYNESRKAILYSPTLKRVVDVAPLSIPSSASSSVAQ